MDAQREYAIEDRDGDALPEYAQKFWSDPGKKNGLYWKVKEGEKQSPLGPLAAEANKQGYSAPRQAFALPRLLLSHSEGSGKERAGRRL